jgi:methylated-DNA-[protein]-cysteine S-methyltransferase
MKTTVNIHDFYCTRNTHFGPITIVWSEYCGEAKISRIFLPDSSKDALSFVETMYPSAKVSSCTEINSTADQIEAFFCGEDIRFSLDLVRLDLCTQFQQTVLTAEHKIPCGRVSTYQRIAGHIGNPRGARAVGTALATNPFPIIIPCHRAIRSDGTLGGFQSGLKMKQALLEMEGVCFNDIGRVIFDELYY